MICLSEADALASLLGRDLHCPKPLCASHAALSAFLAVSQDRQPIHDPAGEALVPANLLLSLLPCVLQSALQVGGHSACYTVGYDRIRFRRPVRAGQVLQVRFSVQQVRRRAGGVYASLDIAIYDEQGRDTLTLRQRDYYLD
ncbi:hypothetical protein Q4485_15020 [Granulosicoccaceae sp. 1_MG-2023]|nr:hypothetical protein [Granulosicoccaceae sp. 1_MG-2023]